MSQEGLLSLELKISKMLRWGVLLAGALMMLGWATMFDFSQNPLLAFHEYKSQTFEQSLSSAWMNHEAGLLVAYAGLMLLISLPLIRVLMTAILFIKQREKILAAIAFFVFAILILSFTLGIEL